MSLDQSKLSDITAPTARERALQGGARYRGGDPSPEAPTGNHGGGSCSNCDARKPDLDAMGQEWWRVFAPPGGPVAGCPNCMDDLHQQYEAIAKGDTDLDDIQGAGQ